MMSSHPFPSFSSCLYAPKTTLTLHTESMNDTALALYVHLFEDQARAPNSDDDFVQEHPVHTMRARKREKRIAVEALQNKENNRPSPRRRLIEHNEEKEKKEEGYITTSTAPRSKQILRTRQNKRSLLNDDEDDDEGQGSSTSAATTTTSSHSRRTIGKETKIGSQDRSLASKISGVEQDEDDENSTTAPEVPWSLIANKDSVLAHGDLREKASEGVHDDDDYWPDKSCSGTDSSENENADEIEIGGARVHTVPVMRQTYESNQYGEMLGRAAQFGKPYLAPGDHERQTVNTFKGPTMDSSNSASNHLGSNHNRTVSSSARSRSRAKGGFNRVRSRGKTSNKGGKRQMSDPDDDNDSTSDPSSSEDDDSPNINLGFGMNTRVFMADGTTKRIKKIHPGEYVLGPDRLPRSVIGTTSGYSTTIQVRELTRNVLHRSDDYFGLVVFDCAPEQALRLATAQHQSVNVYHDNKIGSHVVTLRRLKDVQDTRIVVNSKESFKDSLPNARQEAEDFAHNRSKDVIYWTLPYDRHNLVSAQTQLQTYQLTAAVDFEMGRLRYHALKSGFADDFGMSEKLAYIWGTWVGDGCSTKPRIAVNLKDEEQIARIVSFCHDLGLAAGLWKQSERDQARGCNGGQISIVARVHPRVNHFMIFLRRLGLGKSGSKYVPRWLRKESTSVREHFLAGLIDADGCCEKQEHIFVTDINGSTPHHCDKSSQHRIYKGVPVATIYRKIADGVFVLARSLGISYSVAHRPGSIGEHGTHQPMFNIKLLPCRALTNVLSLCAVDTKWQLAPVTFTRHHIEYRYGLFHQDIVAAIHSLPDLPLVLPQNPVEDTRTLIQQLESSTLKLLAQRYSNFGLSYKEMNERLGVPLTTIAAYFSNKGNNDKLDRLLRDRVFEKIALEDIRRLVLLTRNRSRHHVVSLTLDPNTDGLFVLGNNAVVTSR
ncbi:H(+)-transporting V1 sector ATPase subunit A [Podila minutissima]|uniref:H(+)-transporting V1 sector ATPase subunit A n=1 Tax=Podila minutissima TaxID=64525 RepID=A0A9P5S9I5_9FUNG|nr:H(+)-transporting V1 sector ATPase subunit A [Podila minutissima]